MRSSRRKLAVVLLGALGLCLLGFWGYRLARQSRFDETSLRDLSGIQVTITDARRLARGVAVRCAIENRSDRQAASIVYVVEIADDRGRIVASNPLGNVLDLAPGESRNVQMLVPAIAELPARFHPTARISLVRWGD